MTKYPYDHIWINHKKISLADIQSESCTAGNEFEQNTFGFISRWLNGETLFEVQTSGSTGQPKKISFTRAQMEASALLTEKALSLKQGYHALLCLDPKYIAGKMMLVRCFTTGMLVIAHTPSSTPLYGLQKKIDFAALVPAQLYETLRADNAHVLNEIKTVIIGGGAIGHTLLKDLQRYACTFFATYGMTETLSHIALQQLNGTNAADYFRILPGIQIDLDARDCLVIKAPFLDAPVVTNDIVFRRDHDTFQWMGRFDNIINTGGIKILPEKVEAEIQKAFECLNYERHFFIFSVPDEKLGEKIVLFIEGEEISLPDQERLGSWLRKSLSAYEMPKEVIILSRFNFTETGKINRFSSAQNSNKSIQKFTLKK